MIFRALLLGVVVLSCHELAEAQKKRYDNYQVLRVKLEDVGRHTLLQIFNDFKLDIWRHASVPMPSFDVMVSPSDVVSVKSEFDQMNASYEVLIANVQQLVDNERKPLTSRRQKRSAKNKFSQRYHRYNDIRRWLFRAEREHGDVVRLETVGITYLGRRIIAAKIGIPGNITKKIIWQDGGVHAREWITGATLIWVIKRLIRGHHEKDPEIVRFLTEMDWYIVPIWNVDGYIYSWNKNRMWRKSIGEFNSFGCFGVDLNRNFPTPNRGRGTASNNACSEVFHGDSALSEIESMSVANFLRKKRERIAATITLHSYAQYWLFPYGYTYSFSKDNAELRSLSKKVVREMHRAHQMNYTQGTVSELAYKVSGGSIDWSYDTLCVKNSFAVELRDTGKHGFLLPPSHIIPTAEEYFLGLKVVANHVIDLPMKELKSTACKSRTN